MALASFVINPEAGPMSGDEIVAAINTDTSTTISKAAVVDAAARPLVDAEVTAAKLAAAAAKANLDAMADVDRHYVQTNPVSGEFLILGIDRTAGGLLEVDYDDVAIV